MHIECIVMLFVTILILNYHAAVLELKLKAYKYFNGAVQRRQRLLPAQAIVPPGSQGGPHGGPPIGPPGPHGGPGGPPGGHGRPPGGPTPTTTKTTKVPTLIDDFTNATERTKTTLYDRHCDIIVENCFKGYETGSVCGRSIFYTYSTFRDFCLLEYVNCLERYDTWQVAYMGDCGLIKPLQPGLYFEYDVNEEYLYV